MRLHRRRTLVTLAAAGLVAAGCNGEALEDADDDPGFDDPAEETEDEPAPDDADTEDDEDDEDDDDDA